jgi:hypothetical protein
MTTIKNDVWYEELFDIPEFEGLFSITKDGRVWSHNRDRWILPHVRTRTHYYFGKARGCKGMDTKDFLAVTLHNKKLVKSLDIHRLMANVFLDNPLQFKFVHHLDFNRQNNKLSNLAWVQSPIIKKKKYYPLNPVKTK